MKQKIFKNNICIVEFKKEGKNNFAIFEDGSKINCGQLKNIDIECKNCNKISTIKYRSSILQKEYICQSCIKLGSKNPFFGKSHTDETKEVFSKKKIGIYTGSKNPFFGKSHTDETKEALRSKCAKFGKNNGFFGKTHTNETKNKLSENMKGKFPKEHYSKMGVLSANKRPKKTKIEIKMEQKLKENNVNYKYNFILKRKAQYDFIINDNILLEVHGDYWHGNPKFYNNLNSRQIYKKNRDIEKEKFAIENGFKYLVIWEEQINLNDWSILNEIQINKN